MKRIATVSAMLLMFSVVACSKEHPSLAVACYLWVGHLKADVTTVIDRGVGKPGVEVYVQLASPVSRSTADMLDACAEGRATEKEYLEVKMMWSALRAGGLTSKEPLEAHQVEGIKATYDRLIALLERVSPPFANTQN